ncbi:MAG: DNA polymerase III subunit [Parachlamydiaceae bacterium]
MFQQIIGNKRIKGYLTQMITKGRIGHSFLFAGPEGIGKSLFAENFAKKLICQEDPQGAHLHKLSTGSHPDLHIYRPEGKTGMHGIATMRALSEEVYLPPNEACCKVFIIHEADRMLTYSANALLKTFEEPAPQTIIVLLSSSPELLLPTILSRCSALHFQTLSQEEMVLFLTTHKQLPMEQAKRLAILSQGSVSKACRLCEETKDPLTEMLVEMLSAGKFSGYTQLLEKAKEIATFIEKTIKHIESTSKEELLKGYCDKLTAHQRENVEKEVEGIAVMQQMSEVNVLFDVLLTWYRDLHLLRNGGDPQYLYHIDAVEILQSIASSAAKIPSLEELLEAIKTTKLSLARSTSLSISLENLFLRLNLLDVARH